MSSFYPEESKKLDIISHLEELRKRILFCLVILLVAGGVAFWKGDYIMTLVRRPINGLTGELIFIGPTEAFVAYIKVALLAGLIGSFPLILYQVWAFLSPAVPKEMRGRIVVWLIFAFLLFIAGISFSYFLAIPAALDFLLGFSSGIAEAKITLGNYISFFGALVLIGGIAFEIPVAIGLLADAGIIQPELLKKKRHIAYLGIMIFAAVITPTQDILNMLIFALPMVLLFEAGIIVALLVNRNKS
jgi:sec-independent protein translocase protein TatC